MSIAYLRDEDGTGSLHACSKGDLGAIHYVPLNEKWQPIETAPKDGEEFMVWFEPPKNHPRHAGCCIETRAKFHVAGDLVIWSELGSEFGGWRSSGDFNPDWRVTHWMPLPQPPQ